MRLRGKVTIITGAAQSIGEAIAISSAKEGAKLVIFDILDGKNAVDTMQSEGSEAIYKN